MKDCIINELKKDSRFKKNIETSDNDSLGLSVLCDMYF